jgi:hypothetical protein
MGKEANQVGGLQRPRDIRWSSHFKSISSMIKIYGATYLVLEKITYSHNILLEIYADLLISSILKIVFTKKKIN